MNALVEQTSRIAPKTRRQAMPPGRSRSTRIPRLHKREVEIMAPNSADGFAAAKGLREEVQEQYYRDQQRTIACSCSVSGRRESGHESLPRIEFSAIRPGPGVYCASRSAKPLADGKDFFSVSSQDFHELRIKMPAGVLVHIDESFLHGPGRFIGRTEVSAS